MCRFVKPFCGAERASNARYMQTQPLRVFVRGEWRHAIVDSCPGEGATHTLHLFPAEGGEKQSCDLNEANHARALLGVEQLEMAATRYSNALKEKFGSFFDAFSGKLLDLDTQMARIQFQRGARRSSILNARVDEEDVADEALARARRGSRDEAKLARRTEGLVDVACQQH